MRVLLIGGGGREHALAWRLSSSPALTELLVDSDNAGFPAGARRASGDPVQAAREAGVDLVVIGPEAPLADGLVDRLHAAGVPAFGPTRSAARLESSKAWCKAFLQRHGMPTAGAELVDDLAGAARAIRGPCVVKADGLAAGKGVVVADSADEALAAARGMLAGGGSGARLLIEERLEGPELSVLALCDGARALPLLACRDHKRRHDGDRGPNTGGMGAICPAADAALVEEVRARVLQPAVDAMAAEGAPFRGVLYAGLMLTARGPQVLEFNARFGDPECQPLMMMLDEDLLPLLHAAATGRLPERALRWRGGAAACVVLAADAYPASGLPEVPVDLDGLPIRPPAGADLALFLAGVRRAAGGLRASGGRVMGATAWGPDLPAARARALELAGRVRVPGLSWRTDIGA
jgi:phosphoribosylamine--glycine ligase